LRISIRPEADSHAQVRKATRSSIPVAGEGFVANLAEIVERLATGQISAADEIVAGDGKAKAVLETPELARFVRFAPYHFDRDYTEAAWECSIERKSLPKYLYSIVNCESTGLLIAKNHWHQKRVFFEQGVPSCITSTEKRELIGNRLVAKGFLAQQELESAVERSCRSNKRLGEVLLELSLVEPDVLMRELTAQLEERLLELGSWGQGELVFVEGMSPEFAGPPFKRPMPLVLTRMIREHYADGEVTALLSPVRGSRMMRLLDSRLSTASLGLTPGEQLAVDLAEVTPSVERLVTRMVEQFGVHPSETLRGIFIAHVAGILRFMNP
jgi:hypothetical protein